MSSQNQSLLFNALPRVPLIRASDAVSYGVHPALLSYYAKTGRLERIAPGVYRNHDVDMLVDFQWEDLVLSVQGIPRGVVCLTSALAIYDLTEEIPREHWIAVPHATTAPRRTNCKIVRMRNMTLGLTEIVMGETAIQIFDVERTLVDAFRYLSKETAIKALKAAFSFSRAEKPNLVKLERYACALRVRVRMADFILMVTT